MMLDLAIRKLVISHGARNFVGICEMQSFQPQNSARKINEMGILSKKFFKFNGDAWSNKNIAQGFSCMEGVEYFWLWIQSLSRVGYRQPGFIHLQSWVEAPWERTQYNDPSQGKNPDLSIQSPKVMRLLSLYTVKLRITNCGQLLQSAKAGHIFIHLNALVLNP